MPKSITGQNKMKKVPPKTGMPAAFSQGTAATDNLSALMKNNVIIVNVRQLNVPKLRPAYKGTSDVQQDS